VLVITQADEEERVHVADRIRRKHHDPHSETVIKLGNDERHVAWRAAAMRVMPTLAAGLLIAGNLAAVFGFLGYLGFDVAMLIIIVCGFVGTLFGFFAIRLRLDADDR
jgi:hypothetical protein